MDWKIAADPTIRKPTWVRDDWLVFRHSVILFHAVVHRVQRNCGQQDGKAQAHPDGNDDGKVFLAATGWQEKR